MNEPPSQVNAPGGSRRWISAERVNGVVRWPHSNRSVWRRFAITTNAGAGAVRVFSSSA
jgi:hypothetical protein